MNPGRAAGALLLAIGAGFLVGFVWGRDTRGALPSATDASFADGVLTVKVRARDALAQGLQGLLG